MTKGILISAAAGLLGLACQTATAEVVRDTGFAGSDARFETVDHRHYRSPDFGFYYRDRDGFFFGYDPRSGRRWYRDLIRQRYYERYYDHRRHRWLHSHRHYRDYHDRYRRDYRYERDHRHDYRHDHRHDYRHDRRHDQRGHGRHDRRHRDDDHRRHDRRRGH